MPVARPGVLALLVTLSAACESADPATVIGIHQQSGKDAGAAPDVVVPAANCAGLDECACSQNPGCVPLTTDCWCPPASCSSTADCSCQGGRYLGCNPAGSACGSAHCSLLAQPSVPDENGCTRCVDPSGCDPAVAALTAACPALPADTTAQWLCGGADESCATFCLGSLRTCESAVCALCLDCSCTNDLFDSCFTECLSSAQNRH